MKRLLFLMLVAPLAFGQTIDTVKTTDTPNQGRLKWNAAVQKFVPVFNVRSAPFNAKGDSLTDDLAAFQAAIDTANVVGGAKVVMPRGKYILSGPLVFTGTTAAVEFEGEGIENTILYSSVTDTCAILAASNSTRFVKLKGFSLFQSNLAIPDTQRAENYGIKNVDGVGFQLNIEDVQIRYFANSAIRIEGTTGPSRIQDCYIYYTAGYGIHLARLNSTGPQDVTVSGGAIQFSWGGLLLEGVTSFHASDVDIELADTAHYPCVNVDSLSYGLQFSDCSLSLYGTVSPAAVFYAQRTSGMTIIGGINGSLSGDNHNIWLNSLSENNTVIGGEYINVDTSTGYFAQVTGAYNAFINPLLTATYLADHNVVNLTDPTLTCTIIGVNSSFGSTASLFSRNLYLSNALTARSTGRFEAPITVYDDQFGGIQVRASNDSLGYAGVSFKSLGDSVTQSEIYWNAADSSLRLYHNGVDRQTITSGGDASFSGDVTAANTVSLAYAVSTFTAASRKAIYIAGTAVGDVFVVGWNLANDTTAVTGGKIWCYAKTDSLIVRCDSTSSEQFSYIGPK